MRSRKTLGLVLSRSFCHRTSEQASQLLLAPMACTHTKLQARYVGIVVVTRGQNKATLECTTVLADDLGLRGLRKNEGYIVIRQLCIGSREPRMRGGDRSDTVASTNCLLAPLQRAAAKCVFCLYG